MTPLAVDGFGNQLKLATKHGAKFVVLFGDSELLEGKALLKNLVTGEQKTLLLEDLSAAIESGKDA
jgi:histidyl-tRNA synthetase